MRTPVEVQTPEETKEEKTLTLAMEYRKSWIDEIKPDAISEEVRVENPPLH